jgi:hypothetical protein
MHKPTNSLQKFLMSLTNFSKSPFRSLSLFFLLTLGLTVGSSFKAQAETSQSAPSQLKEALSQIDTAANSRNVQILMQFYSPNFRNSDGLTRSSMQQALTQLWQRYPQLNYRTELQNWKSEGNAIVAETLTKITGTQGSGDLRIKIESTLRSRQRFEGQKIVLQEILAERTQLNSGANPPSIQVNLPDQVRTGQQFNFDVIVKEPVGDGVLLGTAIEEQIKPERYLKPGNLKLDVLPAGGIFKVGKAPLKEDNRWLSAVLIREGGMVMITQRVQVVNRLSSSAGNLK